MQENIKQAKFLTKELLAILKLISEDDYDDELQELLGELTQKLME